MLDMQFITSSQMKEASQQAIRLKTGQAKHLYADYSTYIFHELAELVSVQEGYKAALNQGLGKEKEAIQHELNERVKELLHKEGVIIHTALHPQVQEKAKQALLKHVPQKHIEGAIAVIDHEKNQIIALIGGKDVPRLGFNRAFQSYRQPGSAIKPLLVYAPYLDNHSVSIHSMVPAAKFASVTTVQKTMAAGSTAKSPLKRRSSIH